ncbi:MAG: sensor histidine kinase, partial [Acidimicrobiia bacterium]
SLVTTGDDDRISPAVERHLFRVVQEALSNVVRHASAPHVRIEMQVTGDAVTVVVGDDGVGFDPEARAIAARRLGLTSMRERVESLGGRFEVVSAPGQGTTVTAEVPRG